MKKSTILLILAFFLQFTTQAQKFGFVDSEAILKKMPEYKQAEKEIDKLAKGWQKDLEKMYDEIQKMYRDYQAEEVLLTQEMKAERKALIGKKEKEAKDYQNKMFGYEGLLFLKRQDLIKPVQEKVYKSVEKISKKKKIQIMFDKSSGIVMIYMNPIHDYTDEVLEDLGLKEKEEDKVYNDVRDSQKKPKGMGGGR